MSAVGIVSISRGDFGLDPVQVLEEMLRSEAAEAGRRLRGLGLW